MDGKRNADHRVPVKQGKGRGQAKAPVPEKMNKYTEFACYYLLLE
nr:MAG TPA_asm: hypothetical protein [Caudoviricetes sp.]